MTVAFRYTLVWLVGSFVAMLMALNTVSASFVDGHYIPSGNDSFYHARRILDTAAQPSAFYEFDTRIHVPEGSQLTWPWAYDYLMAMAVRAGVAMGLSAEPMTLLAYLPFLALPFSIALLIGIARELRLSAYAALLAVLCMSLLPLTQILHGIGIVDHHFMELIFTLAAVWSGLRWLNAPGSHARAVIAGCVLGLAPGFHNGMFILQLPLLLALAFSWLRDRRTPWNTTISFAVALGLSTLLIALPSEPVRRGEFEFYLLSWYHIYIAACTGVVALLLSKLAYSRRNLLIVAGIAVLAAVPLLGQMALGRDFVSGNLDMLQNIAEVKGMTALLQSRGLRWLFDYYSLLLLLVPFAIAGCAWLIYKRETPPPVVFFCICSLGGLALLLSQFRMHPYGSFALFLPVLAAVDHLATRRPEKYRPVMALATLGIAVSFALPIKDQLFIRQKPANDAYYSLTQSAYALMHVGCAREPGLVLAGSDAGNYVRYHTECSVIANNFLLTPQHAAKIRELHKLMDLTPEEFLQSGYRVRYILFTLTDITETPRIDTRSKLVVGSPKDLIGARPRLPAALLSAPEDSLGPHFKLLVDYNYGGKDGIPLARLYEVVP
jgi:hypothetical protein